MLRTTDIAAVVLAAFLLSCSGGKGASRGSDRTAFPAPKWFHTKPKNDPRTLYFVGNASDKPDESTAREFSIQKAITELTQYCGATVTSESSSSEVFKDGKTELLVSVNVDIAGDEMTIREAVVKETVVGEGSDGSWDGYALIIWPRAQYAQVLAAQSDRAYRALKKYLEAESAEKQNDLITANTHLREAKSILGPMKSTVPLKNERFGNTSLLYDAMTAMQKRLKDVEKERKRVVAVAVKCLENGKDASCKSFRVGAVKQAVSGSGVKVSTDALSSSVVQEILTSASPNPDASVRRSGYVLAVRYQADLLAKEDGFTFVNCGGRGVVYDTNASRLLSVKEVAPQKGGHVHFEGARKKGCDLVQEQVLSWLKSELAKLHK